MICHYKKISEKLLSVTNFLPPPLEKLNYIQLVNYCHLIP